EDPRRLGPLEMRIVPALIDVVPVNVPAESRTSVPAPVFVQPLTELMRSELERVATLLAETSIVPLEGKLSVPAPVRLQPLDPLLFRWSEPTWTVLARTIVPGPPRIEFAGKSTSAVETLGTVLGDQLEATVQVLVQEVPAPSKVQVKF